MALIAIEGFDFWNTTEGLTVQDPPLVAWRAFKFSGIMKIKAGEGRRGGKAYAVTPGYSTEVRDYLQYSLPSEIAVEAKLGFAIKITSGTAYRTFLSIRPASNEASQFAVATTSDRRLQILSDVGGDVLSQTAANVYKWDEWFYLEMGFTCSGSASMTIRVDGTQIYSAGGLNLRQTGAGGFGVLRLSGGTYGGLAATFYDDLYLLDNTGATFNDFLGDIAIDGHLFTSDGGDSDWTLSTGSDHYACINDTTTTYKDTYIEGDTVGKKDSFLITPTEYAQGILGVEVAAYGMNQTGGTASIRPYCTIGAIRYYGDSIQMVAGTTDKVSYLWRLNPATGGFWTNAVLATTEFGFDVTEIT